MIDALRLMQAAGRALRRLRWLAGGAIVLLVLAVFAWLVRPDTDRPPAAYTPAELAEAEALRDIALDPNRPVIVHVEVPDAERDRAAGLIPAGKTHIPKGLAEKLVKEGKLPSWYPRGESPLLAELVREGVLWPSASGASRSS